jgi:hypothetical protein
MLNRTMTPCLPAAARFLDILPQIQEADLEPGGKVAVGSLSVEVFRARDPGGSGHDQKQGHDGGEAQTATQTVTHGHRYSMTNRVFKTLSRGHGQISRDLAPLPGSITRQTH